MDDDRAGRRCRASRFNRGHQVGRFVLEPSPGVGISLEARIVAVALADQVGAAPAA